MTSAPRTILVFAAVGGIIVPITATLAGVGLR